MRNPGVSEVARRLTVVVATVSGRDVELDRCLASVRHQAVGAEVDLWVSGNGTSLVSSEVASRFGARFSWRDSRLSASEHWRLVLSEATNDYIWPLGDDDVLAPGAIETFIGAIRVAEAKGQRLDALIGRAKFFSSFDLADLGPANPESDSWKSGTYRSLQDAAMATRGIAHIGAFVYRSDLFKGENYDRYLGTSHEIFGAFWDGLGEAPDLLVAVSDSALVFLQQGAKEWDYSPIVTALGLKDYDLLLPEPVSSARAQIGAHLSRRKALYYAQLADKAEKSVAIALAKRYPTKSFGALSLIRLPRALVENLLTSISWSRQQRKRLRRFLLAMAPNLAAVGRVARSFGHVFRRG